MERDGFIRAELVLRSVNDMKHKPAIFSVGGFEAKTEDGREFHFDWDDQYTGCTYDKGHMYFAVQLRCFNDDVYEEENEENDVTQDEITPKFICAAHLTELFYECYMKEADELDNKCEKLELVSWNIYGETNGVREDVEYPEEFIKEYNLLETENQSIS